MRRVAAYAGTRNVYGAMATAAKSLAIHTEMDRIVLLTEDDGFPEPLPGYVETINVSRQKWFDPRGANFDCFWTWMTLVRCALTKILPDEDMVLYLDVDTIVEADISGLFETDMDGWMLAACKEPTRSRPALPYFNAGVMLMNLRGLREHGLDDDIIRILNDRKLPFPDQDVLNAVCQGMIREIGGEYNACDFVNHPMDVKIVHYAASRDYEDSARFREYRAREWPAR